VTATAMDTAAFRRMSARQREVMELAIRGHDPGEIAARLGIGRQSVYSTLSTARKRIKAEGDPTLVRCQFGHPKRPGRSCGECRAGARGERIEPGAADRVVRELAEGKRCRHPMRSGAPCSLLLPCADHEG